MNKLKEWWSAKDEKLKKKFKIALLICFAILIIWAALITLLSVLEMWLVGRIMGYAYSASLSALGIIMTIIWGKD